MGMFDTVTINKELIGEDKDFTGQAKDPDLGCAFNKFIIDEEGNIKKQWIQDPIRFLGFNFHGTIYVYNITGFHHDNTVTKTTYALEYDMGEYVGFTKTIT